MSQEKKNIRIQSRADTAYNWLDEQNNPPIVLLEREIGYEIDTGKYKIGDGISTWNQLKYYSVGAKTSENYGEAFNCYEDDAENIFNTNIAAGAYSHAEGASTLAIAKASHAEGVYTKAFGDFSHVEGSSNTAEGVSSHAEGSSNTVSGESAHAEGYNNNVTVSHAHAEGYCNLVEGYSGHAEGMSNFVYGGGAHAEGMQNTVSGGYAHVEGYCSSANASAAHAEGEGTQAGEIINDIVYGNNSHAEGYHTKATGNNAHAEGRSTTASGANSHAEGTSTEALYDNAHAEGSSTDATNDSAHAEGNNTTASGKYSHAEGYKTTASGQYAHAEGANANATTTASHAEGSSTASGIAAHAEGQGTTASGNYSHSEGQGTIAASAAQHVQGKYNIEDTTNQFAHIVGGGTGKAASARKNIYTLDWQGQPWFAQSVTSRYYQQDTFHSSYFLQQGCVAPIYIGHTEGVLKRSSDSTCQIYIKYKDNSVSESDEFLSAPIQQIFIPDIHNIICSINDDIVLDYYENIAEAGIHILSNGEIYVHNIQSLSDVFNLDPTRFNEDIELIFSIDIYHIGEGNII